MSRSHHLACCGLSVPVARPWPFCAPPLIAPELSLRAAASALIWPQGGPSRPGRPLGLGFALSWPRTLRFAHLASLLGRSGASGLCGFQRAGGPVATPPFTGAPLVLYSLFVGFGRLALGPFLCIILGLPRCLALALAWPFLRFAAFPRPPESPALLGPACGAGLSYVLLGLFRCTLFLFFLGLRCLPTGPARSRYM